jgi:hypothetical protein
MIMDYELGKQLRDAGYPQDKRDGIFVVHPEAYIDEHGSINMMTTEANGGAAYAPTLEELIEACQAITPGRTVFLSCDGEVLWHAATSAGSKIAFSNFKTAEEAVARLWLALHATGDASA